MQDLKPPGPDQTVGPMPRLIDCDVCAGSGVMTARDVEVGDLAAPRAVWCPRCGGQGAFLEVVVDVLPDLAAWTSS